jgi:hypothetical protein
MAVTKLMAMRAAGRWSSARNSGVIGGVAMVSEAYR